MYGGGCKPKPRIILRRTTYREGGIDQHATIGGAHPGYTLPLFLHPESQPVQIREYLENLGMWRVSPIPKLLTFVNYAICSICETARSQIMLNN
jgi:hypothetical protein